MEIAIQYADHVLEKDRESRWISVKDRPLVNKTERGWVSTEDGDNEFLAAVELTNGWWIKHCVLEDEIGLCVVGDSENEPAGYLIEDVLFYQHITPPKL